MQLMPIAAYLAGRINIPESSPLAVGFEIGLTWLDMTRLVALSWPCKCGFRSAALFIGSPMGGKGREKADVRLPDRFGSVIHPLDEKDPGTDDNQRGFKLSPRWSARGPSPGDLLVFWLARLAWRRKRGGGDPPHRRPRVIQWLPATFQVGIQRNW